MVQTYNVDDLLNDERECNNERVFLNTNWTLQLVVAARRVEQTIQQPSLIPPLLSPCSSQYQSSIAYCLCLNRPESASILQ